LYKIILGVGVLSKMTLGVSLRLARIKFKMNGLEVSQKLNLTAPAYRRYERDEVDPSASTMLKLSEVYGCSIQALYHHGGEELDGVANVPSINLNLKAGQAVNIVVNAGDENGESEEIKEKPRSRRSG
jgi:transcriptional regulator with XRE-family HTH domain